MHSNSMETCGTWQIVWEPVDQMEQNYTRQKQKKHLMQIQKANKNGLYKC